MSKTKWYVKAIYLVVAVALIAGIGLVASDVSAAATNAKVKFAKGGTQIDNAASWGTTTSSPALPVAPPTGYGAYAARLNGGTQTSGDTYAAVVIPMGGTMLLSTITSFKYNFYATNTQGYPHVCFYTHDPVDSQTGEITMYSGGSPLAGQVTGWNEVTITPTSPAASGSSGFFWYGSESTSGLTQGLPNTYTLAQFQGDVAFSTHVVDRIQIEWGWWTSPATTGDCWVDKLQLTAGTSFDYNLEPIAMDKAFYKTGATVTVTVQNANASGLVAVSAKSTSIDPSTITISCPETGTGTGIFTGTFQIVNTTPGPGQLLANNGDTITASYTGNWGAGSQTVTTTAIVDDTAPVVNLTAPTSGANLRGTVGINATIFEVNPYTAEIKIDGVQKATSTSTPITYSWDTTTGYPDGAHTVQATATDAAGNTGTPPITVTVDNTPPVISNQVATPPVVKPTPTGVSPIVFTARVVDATSGVNTVTINLVSLVPAGGTAVPMLDNGVAPDAAVDGTYTLAYVNNITAEGTYTLPVSATDNAGNAAATKNITLIVSSDTTPPVITSPAITYPFALASARSGDTVTISATVTDDVGVSTVTATCTGLTGSPVSLVNTSGNLWSWTGTVASVTSPITITAQDAKTNTTTDTSLSLVVDPDITGYVINLNPGWNFISLPLIPGVPTIEDPAITSVLSGVGNIANVTRVDYYYNTGTSTGWQSYVPGSGGTLATMDDGNGYWMWMNAADTLTVKGRIMPPAPAVPPTYPVYAGWNAIGFKSLADLANGTYLAGVTSTVIWGYDATTGYFRVYPSPQTHGSATPGNMEVGYGYWAWVTTSGTIVPP